MDKFKNNQKNQNRSSKKDIKIKNLDSKYKEIIESLKYNKKDIIYNTPTIIEYNQRIFKISTNDFFKN